MPSPLARKVDKVRKRYKREAAKFEDIARNSTGQARDKALARKARAERNIEKLRYDRSSGAYSEFVQKEIGRIEFQSRAENRIARERLRSSGNIAQFYASTKELWQGRKDGTEDQRIINALNEKGFEVSNMNEAIDVVEEITGQDFDMPVETGNEWERYKADAALDAALAIAMA